MPSNLVMERSRARRPGALLRVVACAALLGGAWLAAPAPLLAQGLTDSMNESQRALNDAELMAQQNRATEARALYLQAIRLNPRFIKAFEQYSLFLFARGRFKEGAKAMTIGLKLNPGTVELRAQLGIHLFRLGRVLEAYELLKSSAPSEALHDRFEVQVIYAQAAMLMEDYAAAVAAIDRYLGFRPSTLARRDAAFRVQLATALMRQGAIARAGRVLAQAMSQAPNATRGRLAVAELQLHRGKCREALAALERLRPISKSRDLPIFVGEAYMCMRRYREALGTAQTLLQQMDSVLRELLAKPAQRQRYYETTSILRRALMLRANAALQLGRYEDALAAYGQVEQLAGGTEKVELRIAQTLFQLGRFEQVLDKLKRQLAATPPVPAALVLGVRAAVRAKRLERALELAGQLAKLQDASGQQLYVAGMAHSSAGRFEPASELYRRALAQSPRHAGARQELVRALSYLARRALNKQQLATASKAMTEAHGLDPASPQVNQDLAILELRRGAVAQALEHATAALRARPRDPLVNQLAGRALALQGKHKDAIQRFLRAADRAAGLEGKPLARVLVDLGVSRLAGGQMEQGLADLEQALKLASRSGDAALVALVQRNLLRGRLTHAQELVDRGQAAQAIRELDQVNRARRALAEEDRGLLYLTQLLARAHNGEVEAAREVVRVHGDRLIRLLPPSYAELGSELLLAYIDYHGRVGQGKHAAAPRLERLHVRASSPARDRLRELAVSAYAQHALRAFAGGRAKEATQALAKVKRLARAMSPELRHDLAVVEYGGGGGREESLKTLQAVSAKVPTALCNLAVHFDGKGVAPAKAYDLFVQCEQRGVKFPNLKGILTIKRQIFGRPKGGGA